MTSVSTTLNSTPVSAVSAAILTQNGLSVTNSPAIALTTPTSTSIPVTSVAAVPISLSNNATLVISPATNITDSTQVSQILTKHRLQDLAQEVDKNIQTDDDVEELLLQLAEEFIHDVIDTSCRYAKHRRSNILEVKDVQLSLEKHWNMWIPGYGGDELKTYKKSAITDAHRQRMNLIKKARK